MSFQQSRNQRSVRDLEYSRIEDHNRYQQTDRLYDPLRKVLLQPQRVQSHREYINPAATKSRVTHDYTYLQRDQIRDIKDHTFIPVDARLKATHDLSKVQGRQFMVVDAQQRVLGNPVSQEQMYAIRSRGMKEQRVVYDFGAPKPAPMRTTYRSPVGGLYDAKDKYKYNLYSMIDQPANLIKQSGCGACTCPGNQIIASRNQPQSLGWFR